MNVKSGQLPVHVQHHEEYADQDEEVASGAHDAFRNQPVDVPHVTGDPRNDAPGAVAVVEAQRKPLEMHEKGLAQREEQLLAQPTNDPLSRSYGAEEHQSGD